MSFNIFLNNAPKKPKVKKVHNITPNFKIPSKKKIPVEDDTKEVKNESPRTNEVQLNKEVQSIKEEKKEQVKVETTPKEEIKNEPKEEIAKQSNEEPPKAEIITSTMEEEKPKPEYSTIAQEMIRPEDGRVVENKPVEVKVDVKYEKPGDRTLEIIEQYNLEKTFKPDVKPIWGTDVIRQEVVLEITRAKTGKGRINYDNGNIYEGEYENDKREGTGTLFYKNGDVYTGEWKNDQKHGNGQYKWANGDIYTGEFFEGKIQGSGTKTSFDGNKYTGEWKDGKRHGAGTYIWKNGDKYVGEWKNDEMDGNGTLTFENGAKYVGEFKNGVKHGQGSYTFANGVKYVGEYKDGKKHGRGSYTFPDGNSYNGEWENDKKHGKGVYIWSSGDRYEGEFKDDEITGTGTFYYKNGNVYSGEFLNGRMNGQGTFTWATGNKYTGKWKMDQRDGFGKLEYSNGDVYEGEFKEGKKHGKGVLRRSSGKEKKGRWENDKLVEEEVSEDSLKVPKRRRDRYIQQPDSSFSYQLLKTIEFEDATGYIYNMTSQTWLSKNELDRTIWFHWLTIVKPKSVQFSTALLQVAGGRNNKDPPNKIDDFLIKLAVSSNSVVANLNLVPNQPIKFTNDSRERFEDDLIAYTWTKVLDTRNPIWTARFPMVKATVRAMDTIQYVMRDQKIEIKNFTLAGASKRGWTVWLAAAVDKRVNLVVPLVIDILNLRSQVTHIYRSMCFWPPALKDYVNEGLMKRIYEPNFSFLCEIEDPLSYLERLTIPKLIINAAGDEFFPCDSYRHYYHLLKGEKYLRYVPNTSHSLSGSDVHETFAAFYISHLIGLPKPKYDWRVDHKNGIIEATYENMKPNIVKVWMATNNRTRDFRLEHIGKAWTYKEIQETTKGKYIAKIDPPANGFTAFFIEMSWSIFGNIAHKFTTGVVIVPDILPCEFPKIE